MVPQHISCAEYSVVQLLVIEAAQVIRKQRQFVRRKSNAEAAPVQEVGEWWLYTTRHRRGSDSGHQRRCHRDRELGRTSKCSLKITGTQP